MSDPENSPGRGLVGCCSIADSVSNFRTFASLFLAPLTTEAAIS